MIHQNSKVNNGVTVKKQSSKPFVMLKKKARLVLVYISVVLVYVSIKCCLFVDYMYILFLNTMNQVVLLGRGHQW